MVADTAFAGAEYAIVKHSIATYRLYRAVIQFDRKIDGVDAFGLFKKINQASFQVQNIGGGLIKLLFADDNWIKYFFTHK